MNRREEVGTLDTPTRKTTEKLKKRYERFLVQVKEYGFDGATRRLARRYCTLFTAKSIRGACCCYCECRYSNYLGN